MLPHFSFVLFRICSLLPLPYTQVTCRFHLLLCRDSHFQELMRAFPGIQRRSFDLHHRIHHLLYRNLQVITQITWQEFRWLAYGHFQQLQLWQMPSMSHNPFNLLLHSLHQEFFYQLNLEFHLPIGIHQLLLFPLLMDNFLHNPAVLLFLRLYK